MSKGFTHGKAPFKPQNLGPEPATAPPVERASPGRVPRAETVEPTPFSSRLLPHLQKELARLAVDVGRSRIDLLQEAVEDLLKKYPR